jgi:beta-xylosidase
MATIDNPSGPRAELDTAELVPYRDPDLPIQQRVDDLLARMTLEEKAAQMRCAWREKAHRLVDENGDFDLTRAQADFPDGCGVGQIARPSDRGGGKDARGMAELTNAIQKFFIENSRLGIPVIFHEECLHGHAGVGSTSFPQPIALASTFNPGLVERICTATAHEARSRGAHLALAPVLDVARDPRWGRFEETYGEDPYLVARLGAAAVCGFQGDGTFTDKKRLMATLKHFAGHGQPESGMNCAPANISMRLLRETVLYPFQYVLERAGAVAVMASYNEIDGVPSHANDCCARSCARSGGLRDL